MTLDLKQTIVLPYEQLAKDSMRFEDVPEALLVNLTDFFIHYLQNSYKLENDVEYQEALEQFPKLQTWFNIPKIELRSIYHHPYDQYELHMTLDVYCDGFDSISRVFNKVSCIFSNPPFVRAYGDYLLTESNEFHDDHKFELLLKLPIRRWENYAMLLKLHDGSYRPKDKL